MTSPARFALRIPLLLALLVPAAAHGADPATAAASGSPKADAAASATPLLPAPERGVSALRRWNSSDEAEAAARNHRSPASLRHLIDGDPTVWLSRSGHVFYVDRAEDSDAASAAETPALATSAWALAPLDQTFALHSKPGSNHTAYLDFDGYTVGADDAWANGGGIPAGTYGGFTLDGSAGFSDAEKTYVQTVWRIVAEKFAALDVDVTTQAPSDDALNRMSTGDTTFGVRTVITTDMAARGTVCTATASGGCVGIGWVGNFDRVVTNVDQYQPAWVYAKFTSADSSARSAGSVGNASAHEIGHSLGLAHDQIVGGGSYYDGHDNWFPIMGSSGRAVGHFTNLLSYVGAVSNQVDPITGLPNYDDFDVMSKSGAPLRADDVTDTVALGDAPSYVHDGIIGTSADTDTFSVDRACANTLTASATGIGLGQALDLKVTIRKPDGSVAAVADPATSADTSTTPDTPLNMDAQASVGGAGTGVWTVTVEGSNLDPSVLGGYSDYGSVGFYHLTITGCPSGTAPGAPASVTASPHAHSSSATVAWTPPTDRGGSTITNYAIRMRNGSTVVRTVNHGTSEPLEHTVSGLTPGLAYGIDVIATNDGGDSAPATTTVRIPTWSPITAPSVAPAVSGKTVTLNWTSPNPGHATTVASRVTVLRGSTVISAQTYTGSPSPGPTRTLGAGSYQLRVAIQYASSEGTSWTPTGAKSFTVRAPSAPIIGTASSGAPGGSANAVVRWSAPRSSGSGPVTSYRLYAYRLTSSNATAKTYAQSTKPSTRVFTWGLPAGRYRFRIVAHNQVGASPPSSYSAIVMAR